MRPKILIVEDEYALQATLKEYLINTYDVIAVRTGEEAMQSVREVSYKAAMIDLNLPGISGIETIQHLHKNYKKIALLVITGDKKSETVQKAIQSGADDYIAKPVDSSQLHSRIQKAIAKRVISVAQKA